MRSIICPSCRKQNRPEKLFCVECGCRLDLVCKSCGALIGNSERFCGTCGQQVERLEPAGRINGDIDTEPWAERRQLTVLFSDLVGSTELSERLDLEEFHTVLHDYHQAVSNVISHFGGHVAQYLGDGVLAYFGWPRAYGDDAERAVRASLDILEAVAGLNRTLREHQRIEARIGIHTGQVVVGPQRSGARSDAIVLGGTPIVAARVQEIAPIGGIAITEATNSLVAGLFIVEPLGPQKLKGITAPVGVYRVRHVSGVHERLKATRRLTAFVGRQRELRSLDENWCLVQAGQPRLVHISGEPGIGKSRLVQQFRENIRPDAHTWLEGSCSAFTRNTPLAAVTNLLEAALAWRGDESTDERLLALETGLRNAGLRLEEAVPLVAEMLNLPLPVEYEHPLLAPEQKRQRLLITLTQWAMALAKLQPLVVVVDDLQWADPSTLELLQLVAGSAGSAHILLVLSARQEFRPPWPARPNWVHLPLGRLSRSDALTMARNLSVDSSLAEKTLDLVVERTEGVPLFIEEITRMVAATGGSRISPRQIPSTLADSLMARIDRLGEAKEIAQIASVLGRDFSYLMLREVANKPERELRQALEELSESGLIRAAGLIPDARYLFDHALIRDAAYGSLLKSRLKILHHAVAEILTNKFFQQVEAEPEILAHHLTEANEIDLAVEAWQRAGERAAERGAFVEASSHYSTAIEVLNASPPSRARDQREISLLMALGATLSATSGLASEDAERAFARARALAGQMYGDRVSVLIGLWQTHITRGQMTAAAALAEQSLAAARQKGTALALCWASYAMGATQLHRGNVANSIRHLTEAVRQSGQEGPSPRPFDVGPLSMSHLAVALLLAGFPNQARQLAIRSLQSAERLAKPSNVAFCSVNVAAMFQLSRNPKSVLAIAREAAAGGHAHGLGQLPYALDVYTGWALSALGDPDAGAEQIRRGISGWLAHGQRYPHSWYLALLAWAYALAGRYEQAYETLNDASAAIGEQLLEESFVTWTRADILRRSGGQARELEQAWRDAIRSAQAMGIKLYELRGTVGLCRMLGEHGRSREGHDLLLPLVSRFTEGFDSTDLQEAKALLDELSN